jgi:Flp pilus assembly protein TadD
MTFHWTAVRQQGRRILLSVLTAILVSMAAPVFSATDPAKDQSEAYVALIQADQARDTQDFVKAVIGYRDALDRYKRLASQFPDWEPDIVQYRLTYCANQLTAIVRKTGKTEADWLAEQSRVDPSQDERFQRLYAAINEENRYLRGRLHELEGAEDASEWKEEAERLKTENERLVREVADLTKTDVKSLQRELAELRKAHEALQKQETDFTKKIDALQTELKAEKQRTAEQVGQAKELLVKNQSLEEQLQTLNKKAVEQDELRRQIEQQRQKVTTLEVQLRDSAEALHKSQVAQSNQVETLNQENTALQNTLAQKEASIKSIEDQLAQVKSARRDLQTQREDLETKQQKTAASLLETQAAWSNEVEALAQKNKALQEAVAQKEAAIKSAEEKWAQEETSRRNLQDQLEELAEEQENAQKEFQKIQTAQSNQMEALTKENKDLKETLSQKEAIVKSMQQQLIQSGSSLQALQRQADRAGSDESRVAALESELERLKTENSSLKLALGSSSSSGSPAKTMSEVNGDWTQPVYMHVTEPAALLQAKSKPLTFEEIDVLMKQGLVLEQKGNVAEALKIYDRILTERPTYAQALKARGRGLMQLGDGAGSLAALQECVRLTPTDAQGQLLLGMAYCRVQKFKEAIAVLRPLVLKDSSNVSARNVLGAAWLGQGNMNEARLELEKVLRMNPNLSDAHYNLAQVFVFSRPPDYTQARRHYRRALELGATPDREIEQLMEVQSPKSK